MPPVGVASKDSVKLLVKILFHAIKKSLLLFTGIGLKIFRISYLLQYFFLFRTQMSRRIHADFNKQVAFAIGVNIRKPFSFKAQYFSALSARFNFNFRLCINGWYFDVSPQRRIW